MIDLAHPMQVFKNNYYSKIKMIQWVNYEVNVNDKAAL